MFIEFYQNLRIDLIDHPNLIEASINYENFPVALKDELLNKLKWSKKDIPFAGRYPIFKNNYSYSDDFKQYKIDVAYNNTKNNYENVLKKHHSSLLYAGKYRYIICIQDTTYKNYSKYLKHYLITEIKTDLHYTYSLCITPTELEYVNDWIKESLPTVYLSDLILEFNKNVVKLPAKKTIEGSFKCLRFYSEIKRPKAYGINCFLNDSVATKAPSFVQYYLNEEEVLSLPDEFKFIPISNSESRVAQTFMCNFKNYLQAKNINVNNVFYTSKLTRNFKHENWVNILNVIKSDFDKHNSDINTYATNLFIFDYARFHKPIFNLFNKTDLKLDQSFYAYINNKINSTKVYLNDNKLLGVLTLLVKPDIYNMTYKLEKLFLENFKDFCVPVEIEEVCLQFFNECNNYISLLPFLFIYEHSNILRQHKSIDTSCFLTYINVMEKELNLKKQIEETGTSSTNSDFLNLIDIMETKYLAVKVT